MTFQTELTRWNRAGLSRFEYIGGNAATYLERLRELLAKDYKDWLGKEIPEHETDSQLYQRMLDQYGDLRRDWAWELLRTFARATHVLTSHIDAYANEAYLGTATQWDNLRRLVEMLDYHPAPPASASTHLILTAKSQARGKLAKGFQVKHTPPDGGKPIVFETLEDVDIDARLNALHLAGYGRSPEVLTGRKIELAEPVKDLQIGQPVILEHEQSGLLYADLIHGIEVTEHSTRLSLKNLLPTNTFVAGWIWVHVLPKESLEILAPLSGKRNAWHSSWYLSLVTTAEDLYKGEVICIEVAGKAYYRLFDHADDLKVYFHPGLELPDFSNAWLSRAEALPVVKIAERGGTYLVLAVTGDLSRLQGKQVADFWQHDPTSFMTFTVTSADYYPISDETTSWKGYTLLRLTDAGDARWFSAANPQAIYVPPVARAWAVDTYVNNSQGLPFPASLTTEVPKKISAGNRVAVVAGSQLAWGSVTNVAVDDANGTAQITVANWRHSGGGNYYKEQTRYYGAFKHRLRIVDWDINQTKVQTYSSSNQLFLSTTDLPEDFRTGRTLYIEKTLSDGTSEGFVATLTGRKEEAIELNMPIAIDEGYTIANSVLRGNVVVSGHGERKPEKVLGSGDATRSNQSFVLPVPDIAFVADPAMASGVRADIDVIVSGQRWDQVSTLRDSRPADTHYIVRMTEEGFIRISSGDGYRGRRLPSGRDNVRVVYRVGNGVKGNLVAGKLLKPVKPHRLVDKVHQRLPSNGGNDMEGKASLRETAPASLLSLERAVSRQDFANLATSHSSIWDALAFTKPAESGQTEWIEVVAVPAGGGSFSPALKTELTDYLQAHAVPHVRVRMIDFAPVLLGLDITLRINTSAFDPERVRKTVKQALVAHFKLSERHIGQAVYLSEVYHVVEGVEGVASSTCHFDMTGISPDKRVIRPEMYNGVLYLDEFIPDLDIDYREAEG